MFQPSIPSMSGRARRNRKVAIVSTFAGGCAANDRAVPRAFESAGVEFIDENGGGPGVRRRNRQRLKKSK